MLHSQIRQLKTEVQASLELNNVAGGTFTIRFGRQSQKAISGFRSLATLKSLCTLCFSALQFELFTPGGWKVYVCECACVCVYVRISFLKICYGFVFKFDILNV